MVFKNHKVISVMIYVLVIGIISVIGLNHIWVNIEYKIPTPGVIQVYYDNNIEGGFRFDELHSERREVGPTDEFVISSFKIPFNCLRQIRIDFEQISQVELKQITINLSRLSIMRYKKIDMVEKFKLQSDITIEDGEESLTLNVIGNDPFIGNDNIQIKKVYGNLIICFLVIGIAVGAFIHSLIRLTLRNKSVQVKLAEGKVLISIFICILVIPAIISRFILNESNGTLENRALSEKPKLTIANISKYPTEYETYYNDHIPLKQSLVNINSYLKYNILGISPQNYVIKGEQNWLFYNSKNKMDGDTLADFLGTNHYTPEELNQIAESLVSKQVYLKEKGIDFYVMICPNKMQVYSQYMPDYFVRQEKESKADELVTYLRSNTDLNVVYPKDELIKEKDTYDLYYKWDTHWNEQGAYIGFRCLVDAMKEETASTLENLEVFKKQVITGDLANMISVKPNGVDYDYQVNYRPEIQVNLIEQQELQILKYESNNQNNKKLLMFRDSFATALIPYISKEFTSSTFIWSGAFDTGIIEQEQPQTVIYEVVERGIDALKW